MSAKDLQPAPLDVAARAELAFIAMLSRPKLGVGLVIAALLLSAPALFLGFYLDDYIGRYIYSNVDAFAPKLFEMLSGGYGLANGVPADNHLQIEQGIAPWWTPPTLLLELFRPFGVLTHMLDMKLWPSSALLMHAQNLVWLALLVLAMTRMYRVALGPMVGGLAALLFAIDHTHGFVVGYICNRHALITALFCAVAFERFLSERGKHAERIPITAPLYYVLALLSGESAIAVGGYVFAYLLFVDTGTWKRRALAFAPYLAITLAWRVAYKLAGFGGSGSGLYIDPGHEPLHYLGVLLERGPVLLLGMFFGPPAEVYMALGPNGQRIMLAAAWLTSVAIALALWPLLKKDRLARAFTLGMVMSLVPAASTYPHNRQLLFASFGALGLIAQLWNMHALELKGAKLTGTLRFSGLVGAMMLFVHLVLSPLGLPISTCGIAVAGSLQRAPENIGDDIAGRDVVFMSAPDYFAVKLVQLQRRIDRQPLPRRWRALSFGPQTVRVTRTDDRTLVLDYEGGILSTPFLELYRDRRLAMTPGEHVKLDGLDIEVLEVTSDGRASRARFSFDTSLDAPSFRFYYWVAAGFAPFEPPAVGKRVTLPAAELDWNL